MRKVIIISSAILSILLAILVMTSLARPLFHAFHQYYWHMYLADFIPVSAIISGLVIFISVLVILNLRLPRYFNGLSIGIAGLIIIPAILMFGYFVFTTIKGWSMVEYSVVFPVAVIVTLITYIARSLKRKPVSLGPDQATLIIIGLACAVFGAVGVMWYNSHLESESANFNNDYEGMPRITNEEFRSTCTGKVFWTVRLAVYEDDKQGENALIQAVIDASFPEKRIYNIFIEQDSENKVLVLCQGQYRTKEEALGKAEKLKTTHNDFRNCTVAQFPSKK